MDTLKSFGRSTYPFMMVVTGFTGMLGQLLIIRELLIHFYGNELTLGLILSCWLLCEASGAWLTGKSLKNEKNRLLWFLLLLVIYGFMLPLTIYYGRGISMRLFGILHGEMPGLLHTFLACFVVTAPVAFLHGAMFPLACHNIRHTHPEGDTVGYLYVREMMGTLSGGVIFSLLLVNQFDSFSLAVGTFLVHLVGAFILLIRHQTVRLFWKNAGLISIGLVMVAGMILYLPLIRYLHRGSLDFQWGGRDVVHYENTPYSNVTVIRDREDYSYYVDGRLIATVPSPDMANIGDYVHILLSSHSSPENVLLIGNGIGGILHEILKHPVQKVVYAELDPRLPEIFKKFPNPLTDKELQDPRVMVIPQDGRKFAATTDMRFDVVLMGILMPDTLQTNRFFTLEFFSSLKDVLKDGGIFGFNLPGSPVYMGKELTALNASVYWTADRVFDTVLLIPGQLNLYIASMDPLFVSPGILFERIQQRDLGVGFLTPSYLAYRLDSRRQYHVTRTLLEREFTRLNTDFRPSAFFHALAHHNRAFSPWLSEGFDRIRNVNYVILLILLLVIAVFLFLLFRRKRLSRSFVLSFCIFTTGVSAMGFDLLILLVFQILYGYVARMTGLLMGMFMSGMFLGGFCTMRRLSSRNGLGRFIILEATILGMLVFFYIYSIAMQQLTPFLPDVVVIVLMGMYSLAAGYCTGAQFPIAAKKMGQMGKSAGETGGVLYGADLLGGFAGGLVITVVLFPLVGLLLTLVSIGLMKVVSLLLLISRKGVF